MHCIKHTKKRVSSGVFDWLANLAPLVTRDLDVLTRVVPRLAPATYIYFDF